MSGLTQALRRERSYAIYLLVVLVIAGEILFCARTGAIEAKDIASWCFPLFGTFLGALFAFRLQEGKEKASERRARIEAVNSALLVLASQYNHLYCYHRDVLSKHTTDLQRLIKLSAIGLGERFDGRLRPEKLAFLLEGGHAELLLNLSIEQGRFDTCREVVALRCRIFVEQIEPLIDKSGILGKPVTEPILLEAFGPLTYGALKSSTAQVYQHVTSTLTTLLALGTELRAIGKATFPGENFIQFAPDNRPPGG